ncbi:mitochondrial protein [Gymnopilus junonius]|uniref:Mitochondrial protein n=1 Tax=Gymnopilus junonius TaxID=109634 RepID=A0A9P5TFF9_GYMJU|nr:mitochondrial protein [Gymnopilus junonius]
MAEDEITAPPLRPPLHNSSSPRDKEPKEVDKILKWQQERIGRRLRGEYESAILHLSEVVNNNLKTPVNVSSIRVEGAPHTRLSFLESIIKPAIPPPSSEQPSTLEDILHTTRRISYALRKTDVFSSIETYVDRPRDMLAQPGDVDLVFKTKERGRYFLSSSTELGNNEGSANVTARVRNVFGGAENFEANYAVGTKTRQSFRGALSIPISADMNTFGELSAYALQRDLTTYASCFEGLRGVRAALRHGTPGTSAHELAYDGVIRHISSLSPTASISMREAAGVSIKSSLSHTLSYDTRDDKITATQGLYGKIFQEIAGLNLGGDSHFYKIDTEGQISRKIGDTGLAISLAARGGLLWGLSPEGKTHFSDRFQLGGPTSVRTFRQNSMGPKHGSDYIGGALHYSVGASIISDVPSKAHWPVKIQGWANAGRLDEINRDLPLKENVLNSLSRPSISAGVGLIYRFDPIRIEVNFGVPLAASASDGTRRGLQVGMGLDFL